MMKQEIMNTKEKPDKKISKKADSNSKRIRSSKKENSATKKMKDEVPKENLQYIGSGKRQDDN